MNLQEFTGYIPTRFLVENSKEKQPYKEKSKDKGKKKDWGKERERKRNYI